MTHALFKMVFLWVINYIRSLYIYLFIENRKNYKNKSGFKQLIKELNSLMS